MSEVQQNPAERISVAHINNHMLKHPLLSSDGICLVRKDYGKWSVWIGQSLFQVQMGKMPVVDSSFCDERPSKAGFWARKSRLQTTTL